ncbi:hypothetical protein BJV78DRAFT_1247442, partial [Lactifluus subvellereus]
ENPKRRETTYKQILEASKSTVDPDVLRDQETALVELGELYRDQKNAQGPAEVVTLSRSFLPLPLRLRRRLLNPFAIYFHCSMASPIISKLRLLSLMTTLNGQSAKRAYF